MALVEGDIDSDMQILQNGYITGTEFENSKRTKNYTDAWERVHNGPHPSTKKTTAETKTDTSTE